MDSCLLVKNRGKNLSKNISEDLGGKHNQKLLDQAKQSATDVVRLLLKSNSIDYRSSWWHF